LVKGQGAMRNKIICGHVLDILKTLPDCLVDCIVTSPPYWGLRDYGTEPVIWGGDPECVHEWGEWREKHDVRESVTIAKSRTTDRFYGEESRRFDGNHQKHTAGAFCRLCGAWRGSLGLEPTLDLYIEHLVTIFREAHRVLKDEGVMWLNMGDAYYGGGRAGSNPEYYGKHKMFGKTGWNPGIFGRPTAIPPGFKPKDMVGQPWRLAFALQADGWYLRSDIIWAKPNPMPESVSGTGYYRHKVRQIIDGKKEWVECPGCEKCNPHDGYVLRWNAGRPTKSHEYIFLLSKSAKYYYDAEAIKETSSENTHSPGTNSCPKQENVPGGQGIRANSTFPTPHRPPTRNKRTVWTIATQPFPEAHFATFPEKLIEPCIRAGTSEKGYCSECGKPWVRVIDKEDPPRRNVDGNYPGNQTINTRKYVHDATGPQSMTVGWQPSCSCGADIVPGLVCDPFGGSGTVALESKKLGRDYLIIELSPEYVDMANKRVRDKMGLFA